MTRLMMGSRLAVGSPGSYAMPVYAKRLEENLRRRATSLPLATTTALRSLALAISP